LAVFGGDQAESSEGKALENVSFTQVKKPNHPLIPTSLSSYPRNVNLQDHLMLILNLHKFVYWMEYETVSIQLSSSVVLKDSHLQ